MNQELSSYQERDHNRVVAQKLLQEGYAPKEILTLSRVPELGLDETLLKETMALQNANTQAFYGLADDAKNIARTVAKYAVHTVAAMYTPFSVSRIDGDTDSAAGKFFVCHFISGIVCGVTPISSSKNLFLYAGVAATVIAADGIYERYRSLKQRAIKENLSKLESLAEESTS